MNTNTKLISVLVSLLLISGTAVRADRQYTLCDPAKAAMCASLVALYEFEEVSRYGVSTSETGSAPLYDVPGGTVQTSTPGKVGSYCLDPDASRYVYIPRTLSLGGSFTINLWIYVESDSANESNIMATYDANGTQVGSRLYFSGASGSRSLKFGVKQAFTDTVSSVTSASTISSGAWHFASFGVYPNPSSTLPYQTTLWIKVDNQNIVTQNINAPPQVFIGDFRFGDAAGNGNYKFDQLSVFGGTLSNGEIAWLYNSGNGRAYPFTVNP